MKIASYTAPLIRFQSTGPNGRIPHSSPPRESRRDFLIGGSSAIVGGLSGYLAEKAHCLDQVKGLHNEYADKYQNLAKDNKARFTEVKQRIGELSAALLAVLEVHRTYYQETRALLEDKMKRDPADKSWNDKVQALLKAAAEYLPQLEKLQKQMERLQKS